MIFPTQKEWTISMARASDPDSASSQFLLFRQTAHSWTAIMQDLGYVSGKVWILLIRSARMQNRQTIRNNPADQQP